MGAAVNVPPWTSGTEADRIDRTGAGTEMGPTTGGGGAGATSEELTGGTSAEKPRAKTVAEVAPAQGGAQIDRGMVQAAVDVADRRKPIGVARAATERNGSTSNESRTIGECGRREFVGRSRRRSGSTKQRLLVCNGVRSPCRNTTR